MNRKSHNLQHHLLAREHNLYPGRRHPVPSQFLFHEQNFYKSITPRLSVQNVESPPLTFLKFSPNGKYLVGICHMQTDVCILEYLGVGNAADLLSRQKRECVSAKSRTLLSKQIREELFIRIFDLLHYKTIVKANEMINENFCLFLDNGNFVLLASSDFSSAIQPNYSNYERYTDIFDDTHLDSYTFYLIDLKKGDVVEMIKYESDYFELVNQHDVSLYGNTMAILSSYRQCVEIFLFIPGLRKLQRSYTVGPFFNELDRDIIFCHEKNTNFVMDATRPKPYSHLKQKIFTYMYRKIMFLRSARDRQVQLRMFHKNFKRYERMNIFKMQLIDQHTILLAYKERLESKGVENSDEGVSYQHRNYLMFVFYSITFHAVLRVVSGDSPGILWMYRNFNESFRNAPPFLVPWHSISPSTNDTCRKKMDSIVSSFEGTIRQAAENYNNILPISSQIHLISPYLDLSLFNYDDDFLSEFALRTHETLKEIRVTDRETDILKFRILLDIPRGSNVYRFRDSVSYIFHPYEPFILTNHTLRSRSLVNFHLYCSNVIPKDVIPKVRQCKSKTKKKQTE